MEAFSRFKAATDAIEAEVSTSPHIVVYPGKIACSKCVEIQNGTYCTAELTLTRVALRGQEVLQQPELEITSDIVDGFKLYRDDI
jgi:hypothetical protein